MVWKLCDDLTGSSEDVQPITLGYDGDLYVLHLGPESRALLEKDLHPWLSEREPNRSMPSLTEDAIPPVAPRARPRNGRRPTASGRNDLQAVRTWAAQNGFEIKSYGRLAKEVLAAYDLAMTKA